MQDLENEDLDIMDPSFYEATYYRKMQIGIVDRMKEEQDLKNKQEDIKDIVKNSKMLFFASQNKKSYLNRLPEETITYISSFTGKNGVLPAKIAENMAARGFHEAKLESNRFSFKEYYKDESWGQFQEKVLARMRAKFEKYNSGKDEKWEEAENMNFKKMKI